MINNRRNFIKQITALGTVASLAPSLTEAMPVVEAKARKEGEGYTFLFQGDSITDGNRTRNNDWNHIMGHGYAYIIASKLGYEFPGKGFHFYNRGISGNKIPDLATRWKTDTLDIKPNVLSILIGINDVSAFLNGNKEFSAEQYEIGYKNLLDQTVQQLPDVQLVLCEPFILPVGNIKDKWEAYSSEVRQRRDIVKKLSTAYNAILVEFQQAFNKALTKAPADYWIWDGIHPMPAGHELMARKWMIQVGKKLKFIRG
ncbi:SGNH/GDSL hydrolase family protein [Rhodocytophaga rosea]|uniref:SGNH/GDSL hydrolase family protein n=1 Tax=Rhodocytophaga rosea TaxID=2704465 RepID=A0A6C0GC21_9BACT|nr:SGNH/GDSL hydrolase family protein [Rhodocytophaga rosea]QHT65495.1 SGNH/GDSL hydrolase family protein [Rhodocytophaga rosea]